MNDKDKLFLVTIANYKSFYVISKDPTSAYERLSDLLHKKNWFFLQDRELKEIKLIAESSDYANTILICGE